MTMTRTVTTSYKVEQTNVGLLDQRSDGRSEMCAAGEIMHIVRQVYCKSEQFCDESSVGPPDVVSEKYVGNLLEIGEIVG